MNSQQQLSLIEWKGIECSSRSYVSFGSDAPLSQRAHSNSWTFSLQRNQEYEDNRWFMLQCFTIFTDCNITYPSEASDALISNVTSVKWEYTSWCRFIQLRYNTMNPWEQMQRITILGTELMLILVHFSAFRITGNFHDTKPTHIYEIANQTTKHIKVMNSHTIWTDSMDTYRDGLESNLFQSVSVVEKK